MFTTVLIDFDGTIIESGPGIMRSVRYALEKCGRPEVDDETLRAFIGPPLLYSFMHFIGMDREEAERAICFYRERYREKGVFETALYPGIVKMLAGLRDRTFRLAVASSKPEVFVKQILTQYRIDCFFEEMVGSSLSETDAGKPQIITEALRRLGPTARREEAVMVGDREYDIRGAREVGLRSIGVTYGYGSREELLNAGADWIADSTGEVLSLLMQQKP